MKFKYFELTRILPLLAAIVLNFGVLCAADIESGLVTHYLFNGNADDVSGSAKHGVVSGAIPAADRFLVADRAYSFNGVDQYIRGNSTIDDVINTFTISMWCKPTASHRDDRFANYALYPSHGQTTWGDSSVGIGFSVGTDRVKIWEHTHDHKPVVLEHVVDLSNWNLITVVYENRIPKLFINGEMAATGVQSIKTTLRPSNGQSFSSRNQQGGIGGGQTVGGDSHFFEGLIDDFRIYGRALSTEDVAALFVAESTQIPRMYISRAVRLDIDAEVGKTYQLQYSDDLETWLNWGDQFVAEALTVTEYADADTFGRFWKLVEIQP